MYMWKDVKEKTIGTAAQFDVEEIKVKIVLLKKKPASSEAIKKLSNHLKNEASLNTEWKRQKRLYVRYCLKRQIEEFNPGGGRPTIFISLKLLQRNTVQQVVLTAFGPLAANSRSSVAASDCCCFLSNTRIKAKKLLLLLLLLRLLHLIFLLLQLSNQHQAGICGGLVSARWAQPTIISLWRWSCLISSRIKTCWQKAEMLFHDRKKSCWWRLMFCFLIFWRCFSASDWFAYVYFACVFEDCSTLTVQLPLSTSGHTSGRRARSPVQGQVRVRSGLQTSPKFLPVGEIMWKLLRQIIPGCLDLHLAARSLRVVHLTR